MAFATPQDRGTGAVVQVLHHDGKSVVETIGVFSTVEKAKEYATDMDKHNSYLKVQTLTPA